MAAPRLADPAEPQLTAKHVQKLADPSSYSRGERYHNRGMIFRTIRRGDTLAASCRGSSGGPYEVRLTLSAGDPAKIVDWSCTCPLGIFCKHLVALSLTWIETPAKFESKPSVDELLANQDRAGLIAIIHRLLQLEPMLETALEKAIPPAPLVIAPAQPGDAAIVTAPVVAIRKRVNEALDANTGVTGGYGSYREWGYDRGYGYGYDEYGEYDEYAGEEAAAEAVESAFAEAIETAERYEQAGRYADATALFAVVAEVGTSRFDDTFESDGVFHQIFAAGRGLVRCLERQETLPESDRISPSQRTELIQAFYEIWLFAGHGQWGDADGSGVPGSDADVTERALTHPDVVSTVAAHLTAEERQALDKTWRADAADTLAEDWRRRTAIAFAAALVGPGGMDEAEVLDLIVAAELWWDQVTFLLNQGRVAEATAVATRKLTEPRDALNFANALAGRGEDGPERAIRFVDERLWETEGKTPAHDLAYLGWLADAYAANDKPSEAIEARLRIFKLQPHFATYQELERLASSSGIAPERWAEMRTGALKLLAEKGNRASVMQIHLAEGNARGALALLEEKKKPAKTTASATDPWNWNSGVEAYREQVAQLAEREFPDEAIRLYRQLAEQLISYKQRSSYQQAVPHLAAVKRLLEANGRAAEWTELIRNLRQEHKTLRALQQELDIAGL
jgi:hypothetical protein